MSKRETTILKGIAILMMLFFHLFLREEIIELCHPLIYLGDRPLVYYFAQACYPVTFYMILSGYGLTYLYNQGMLSLKKQTKRLFKLYIHYWLVLIIFVSIAYFIRPNLYKYDLLHIIGNITAIRCNYNGEVWFLFPYASISLTSFPIIHYVYQLKDKNKIFFTVRFSMNM